MGWESVILNHASILSQVPSARLRLFCRVLYRYGVAGDWKAVRRALHNLWADHPSLSARFKATLFVLAGVMGHYGGDHLRLRLIRMRESGFLHPARHTSELG